MQSANSSPTAEKAEVANSDGGSGSPTDKKEVDQTDSTPSGELSGAGKTESAKTNGIHNHEEVRVIAFS